MPIRRREREPDRPPESLPCRTCGKDVRPDLEDWGVDGHSHPHVWTCPECGGYLADARPPFDHGRQSWITQSDL